MKPIYHVNVAKKTVVCRLVECNNEIDARLIRRGFQVSAIKHPKFCVPDVIIGKAVCCQTDTFDEEFGKKLAYSRAMAQFNIACRNLMTTIMNAMENEHKEAIKVLENIRYNLDSSADYHKRFINEILQSQPAE